MRKMMPIGPLMIEHRLIERMIDVMRHELDRISRDHAVDRVFIDTAVDFIRIYADRCHHGKEEDILFRELKKKNLSAELSRIMNELIEEHKWGRATTKKLVEGANMYEAGDVEQGYSIVIDNLSELVGFYPKHIEKEDKHFFLPAMRLFSQAEKEKMLQEGLDFDEKLIHELYRAKVEQEEQRRNIL